MSAPRAIARRKARSVFSGSSSDAPRWAMIQGRGARRSHMLASASSRESGRGHRHILMAPPVSPLTSARWKRTNSTSSGSTDATATAETRCHWTSPYSPTKP